MNLQKVEILLNHFFEGKTTSEEEAYLREVFQREDLPEHLEKYRPVFVLYKSERETRPAKQFPEMTQSSRWHKSTWMRRLAMAATVAILISTGLFIDSRLRSVDKQEVHAAYKQTHSAIMMASSYLTKGMGEAEEMKHLGEAIDQTERMSDIAEAMDDVQKLEQIETGYNKTVLFTKYTNYQPFKIK